MKPARQFAIAFLCGILSTASTSQTRDQRADVTPNVGVRYHGLLIRVPDLDRAFAFYSGVLGFSGERLSPTLIRLRSDNPIYLEHVNYVLRPPATDEARSSAAFQTMDIEARVASLRARSVQFLSAAPSPIGVGKGIRFLDPFGNNHALVEHTISPVSPFEEPKVYNTGFKHPDADTAALRALIRRLGFVVRSERYYPPSIPIGHADGSFAFMLHENEPYEPEVRPRIDPQTAAVSLILTTNDFDEVIGLAQDRQLKVRVGRPIRFSLGRRLTLTIPSGVPIEFWHLSPPRNGEKPD